MSRIHAVVFVVALLAQSLVRPTETPNRPPEIIRHVWTGPPPADLDDTWAVSPVGDLLAYRDEQLRLAVYEIRSGQTRLLADGLPVGQSRTRMVWSPDGSQLAYNRSAAGDQVEIRLAALDDRPVRVVMGRHTYVAPLAWSPDGQRLLVVIELGSIDELAWVSVVSGEMRLVTRLQGTHRNEWHPKAILSPDGQQLAFSKLTGDRRTRDVFVANADGTLEAPVVEHPSDDYPIAWAAAGNELLFASDRTGSTDLWAIPMTGRTADGIPKRVRRDLGLVRPLGLTEREP